MTTNVEAIRRLFQVGGSNDKSGNLPAMPGIYPDYPAPIVRNGGGARELAMARWGMASRTATIAAVLKSSTNSRGFIQLWICVTFRSRKSRLKTKRRWISSQD
jgi:putative SOS response-associated peptidase YedK